MKRNLYFQICRRILLVFLLYTLCRFVFYLYNYDLYSERTFSQLLTVFIGGMRFDVTAIIYTNMLYFLMFLIPFKFRYSITYQTVGKYIYLITNSFALLTNCMDTVYFRNTFRRTTLSIFREFSNGEKIGAIVADALIRNWYLALVWLAMIALMAWRYGKPVDKSSIQTDNPRVYYTACTLGMLAGFFIGGALARFFVYIHPEILSLLVGAAFLGLGYYMIRKSEGKRPKNRYQPKAVELVKRFGE